MREFFPLIAAAEATKRVPQTLTSPLGEVLNGVQITLGYSMSHPPYHQALGNGNATRNTRPRTTASVDQINLVSYLLVIVKRKNPSNPTQLLR
jgi:hypothetical protein